MGHKPQTYRYFLMTLDPVHIGTGGTRLGRVDLSIVREPGTHLPKIPGTSLHGVIRAYAAHRYGKSRCAGQGQPGEGKEGHCGRPTCPICYTFGSVQGERAYSGVVSIGDARILLFPVYSMVGPVWVTSPTALADAGLTQNGQSYPVAEDKARWPDGLISHNHLNLGWLMVEREEGKSFPDIPWPDKLSEQIRNRVVLISDALFSQVVNSNLEVRTSVSINPETGAAEEGALFTYEAIPRATVLWMDVVVDDFRDAFPGKGQLTTWQQILEGTDQKAQKSLLKQWFLWQEKDGNNKLNETLQRAIRWVEEERDLIAKANVEWRSPADVVAAGLAWAEHLGIGGMGTRGFGRVRCLAIRNTASRTDNPCREGTL